MYKVGNYTFDNEDDFNEALEDVKLIKKLRGMVDLHNAEVKAKIVSLYNEGNIEFKSEVGRDFVKLLQPAEEKLEEVSESEVTEEVTEPGVTEEVSEPESTEVDENTELDTAEETVESQKEIIENQEETEKEITEESTENQEETEQEIIEEPAENQEATEQEITEEPAENLEATEQEATEEPAEKQEEPAENFQNSNSETPVGTPAEIPAETTTETPAGYKEFVIIKPASKNRNYLSIALFFAVAYFIFFVCAAKGMTWGLGAICVVLVCYAIMGIRNLDTIEKNEKAAREYYLSTLSEEEREKAKKEDEVSVRNIIFAIVFALLFIIPPLGLIVLAILTFVSQLENIKWLLKNWRAAVLWVVIASYYYALLGCGVYASNNGIYKFLGIIHVAILTLLMLACIKYINKRQTYLSVRFLASYPITLVCVLAPFALIALRAYAISYNDMNNQVYGNGGNPNGGIGPQFTYGDNPPTMWVNNPNVQDGGYVKTMPDNTITNNLSFKG